ncbi:MAG: YjbQ family protein [Planctomycetes bacterium]|nr:YjbQ family protein [Planctomycetota bacterium]
METISVKSRARTEMIDITGEIQKALAKTKIKNGLAHVYIPHTTAGVTINENADPSVREDIINTLNRLIPESGNYRHSEGNSDAHVKSSLTGTSQFIPVEEGRLALGTWQGIFFCEFDGPRSRNVYINILER